MSGSLRVVCGWLAVAGLLAGCAGGSAAPAPPPPAAPSALSPQQLLDAGVDRLRAANTGSVTSSTERIAYGAVRTLSFDGRYDLGAARWSAQSTVRIIGSERAMRAVGVDSAGLTFDYVGTDSVMYAALRDARAGKRKWVPLELDRALPGSGPAGVALIDALDATQASSLHEIDGKRILIGELPTAQAVQLLGLKPELNAEEVRPGLLQGFAQIEITLDEAGTPTRVTVLGATLQSLNLADKLRTLASLSQYTARIDDVGTTKVTAPLPRESEVLPAGAAPGGTFGA